MFIRHHGNTMNNFQKEMFKKIFKSDGYGYCEHVYGCWYDTVFKTYNLLFSRHGKTLINVYKIKYVHYGPEYIMTLEPLLNTEEIL